MVELLEGVKSGRDCPRRAPHAAAQLSMGVAGPQGHERATREAIDSKTGVIPCAETASPPPFFFSVVTVSTSRREVLTKIPNAESISTSGKTLRACARNRASGHC